MGVLDNMKEVADLVKKVGDVELYRRIVELEGEVIELTREKRALEERVEEQDRALRLQGDLKFRSEGFYWMDGDRVPYCPRCWEATHTAVHLFHAFTSHDYSRYECPECKQSYKIKPIPRSTY